MRAKNLNGFSLMEMMVVLLIVAVVAAASAPMVTKKLTRNAGTGDSPWVFTGMQNSIAYNMNGNNDSTAIIGATAVPNSLEGSTRLFIDSGNASSHIAFGHGAETPLQLTADPQGRIGFSNAQIPNDSVAFGIDQELNNTGIVAIGNHVTATGDKSIVIGTSCGLYNEEARAHRATGTRSISIGTSARATGDYSIAIGSKSTVWNEHLNYTEASAGRTIAIGTGALVSGAESIAIGSDSPRCYGTHSVAIGPQAVAGIFNNTENNSMVAIGSNANASNEGSVAMGTGADASANWTTVVGTDAGASQSGAIALGAGARATGQQSIAIGNGDPNQNTTRAQALNAIAIGTGAHAEKQDSIAIGTNAVADVQGQIRLGSDYHTVYIPGNLVVGGQTWLGANKPSSVNNRAPVCIKFHKMVRLMEAPGSDNHLYHDDWENEVNYSDRRLKNVGEKYTAGLEELKKLDFFHFTFKKDESKTPHVGVIAQDLQKVFPDSVTKDEDGYLRIRWEDMFYAVINAVKELDNKISEITKNITDIRSIVEKQAAINEEQNKTIEEQQKIIEKLEKRIEQLEKQK